MFVCMYYASLLLDDANQQSVVLSEDNPFYQLDIDQLHRCKPCVVSTGKTACLPSYTFYENSHRRYSRVSESTENKIGDIEAGYFAIVPLA